MAIEIWERGHLFYYCLSDNFAACAAKTRHAHADGWLLVVITLPIAFPPFCLTHVQEIQAPDIAVLMFSLCPLNVKERKEHFNT